MEMWQCHVSQKKTSGHYLASLYYGTVKTPRSPATKCLFNCVWLHAFQTYLIMIFFIFRTIPIANSHNWCYEVYIIWENSSKHLS